MSGSDSVADIFQSIGNLFSQVPQSGIFNSVSYYIVFFSRYLLPIIALAIIFRCAYSMLRERYEPEVWGYLDLPDGSRVPLRHWECTIGSSGSCDVTVVSPTVQGTQLVLVRDEYGSWTVYDIIDGGTSINGVAVPEEGARLEDGDILKLGDCFLRFFNLTEEERAIISERRTAPGNIVAPGAMFRYVSVFQFLLMYSEVFYAKAEYRVPIVLAFLSLFIIMWVYFIAMRSIGRTGLEVEVIAFFLSTIGLAVAASATPENLLKQIILLLVGIVMFLILGWWMRDLERVKTLRIPAGAVAMGLLALNLVLAKATFGAKNWLSFGGYTIQPSELVKIVYIYAGAQTLDRLYRGKNLIMYIGFSAICVGVLALMGDYGSALVFFATFLVISFMRSGSIGTVLLAVSGAGLGGFLALSIKPYIAQRFATWGHVWENVNGAGFQQTRAMSATASGGFFGLGAGNGWLHKIVAADTDLVYGMVCEELGFIIAICTVVAIIVLAAFTVHNAVQGRSSFYVIAGCAAVSMMMVQLGLNVFGAFDILPFTGVTFPFVSVGGSSLISCWAMLAYIKATDTRKGASFTIKDPTKIHDNNEFTDRSEEDRDLFDRHKERKGGKQ